MAVDWQVGYQYAVDVDDGTIPAGQWVRKACRRFLDDLTHGHERGLALDVDKAQDVLDFYDHVPHIQGEWAGQPITPSPWEVFILINLFGWVWADSGLRRFRQAYIEVARKNGKSTFVAPLGLYMLRWDHEPGAQIYSAATSRDQARIVFDTARDMTRHSKLRNHLQAFNHSVCHERSHSSFKPLASDSDSLEGKNTHLALIDELHAHKNRRVYDVLELSCGARRQSLLLVITTAGEDQTGICYEVRGHLIKVLEQVYDDDSVFGVIYAIDDPDQWTDESTWLQANPNLGICPKLDDLRRLCRKAQQTPGAASEFKRKRLGVWGEGASAYFSMEHWRQCPPLADDAVLATLPGFLGLDLASKRDITALVGVFPDADRHVHLKGQFWLPEAVIDARTSGKSYHIQQLYRQWADQGWLTLTPGPIIDYEVIREAVLDWCQRYDVQAVAYDPWGATQLATQLFEQGLPMIEVQQSVRHFSEAMKEEDALIIDHRLHHAHSPLMIWMWSNVLARVDKNDNVFPQKQNDESKIDGPVASFMAMNRALVFRDEASVYDEEDLLVV